jgi:hypothetical protein
MWGETGLHQIVPQTDTSMPSLQKAWSGPHREAPDRKVVGKQRAVHPARCRRTDEGLAAPVAPALDRDNMDARDHIGGGDADYAGGGRGDVQAERAVDRAIECQGSPR